MEMTKEQEKLIIDNERLAHYIANKYYEKNSKYDYEDFYGLARVGLIKAALVYNPKKGKFSTIAVKCMRNEILMFFRKVKNKEEASLEEVIHTNKDGSDIRLEELIYDKKTDLSNYADYINNDNAFEEIISYIISDKDTKKRNRILYILSGMKQREIAEKMKISQPQVSRIGKKFIKDAKDFRIKKTENKYIFIKQESKYAVKILLENLPSNLNLDFFEKFKNNFEFIEKEDCLYIIFDQDFYYFRTLVEILDYLEKGEILEDEKKVEIQDSRKENNKEESNKKENQRMIYKLEISEGKSITKELKFYLLSLEKFREEDLFKDLDNIPKAIIKNVIRLLVLYNDIYLNNFGEYIVNRK